MGMLQIYNILIYQPLFNLLVWLYTVIPGQDVGVAIVLLTIIVKIIFYPLSLQSIRSQKALQTLQPKLDALKKTHSDNKEALARATMELYKTEKVNPLSSCLPLLIQLPVFIALYQVLRQGLGTTDFSALYPFVANPGALHTLSFGVLNLAAPSIALAVLAGAAQFWQSKMLVHTRQPRVEGAKDESMTAIMNKQMLYVMPAMTVFIGWRLPAGLTLYWLVTTALTALQQLWMFRKKPA
ncbi:hypothetical protein A3J43_04030 [Candidatus Uhrbacteria bacterium RIFCSPHIGHO2_12_FULL_54_23]|uniref:Membrane insertase YidC/Oxa/ALB C-terminal domain-containing protein n=3 Tax=Candidatus Uhriibacteriota TaxID=1752732 RepID=A0A1F7UFG9_9BACT|nr:MAG: hypothetical protein A3J43_04030 [Candidatus Uhrbacteria bacterium RIFCSPHIGHO2_12_FULL_54_23]OGL85278.1 MAG: hypothetical protein A3B36_01345 [Candidatus Uhrbacteria bacterium RIFCSPLOWO2_01_FULL_55_36]OGL89535.1 MAG: hypothetical protein A3J36_00610 [Candidatus Uhrbacteria bacterium RIFCSPLOWO2_02_FULL_54_37]